MNNACSFKLKIESVTWKNSPLLGSVFSVVFRLTAWFDQEF